jgi:hypothetical protein
MQVFKPFLLPLTHGMHDDEFENLKKYDIVLQNYNIFGMYLYKLSASVIAASFTSFFFYHNHRYDFVQAKSIVAFRMLGEARHKTNYDVDTKHQSELRQAHERFEDVAEKSAAILGKLKQNPGADYRDIGRFRYVNNCARNFVDDSGAIVEMGNSTVSSSKVLYDKAVTEHNAVKDLPGEVKSKIMLQTLLTGVGAFCLSAANGKILDRFGYNGFLPYSYSVIGICMSSMILELYSPLDYNILKDHEERYPSSSKLISTQVVASMLGLVAGLGVGKLLANSR